MMSSQTANQLSCLDCDHRQTIAKISPNLIPQLLRRLLLTRLSYWYLEDIPAGRRKLVIKTIDDGSISTLAVLRLHVRIEEV